LVIGSREATSDSWSRNETDPKGTIAAAMKVGFLPCIQPRVVQHLAAVLLIWVSTTLPLPAQITTGTIMGTVRDQIGAVLPNAVITIRNTETGFVRKSITDGRGQYREPQLQIGSYEVQVELEGFQLQIRRGLRLAVGTDLLVNFSLKVGDVQMVINVRGEGPVVQSTTAEVSSLVDSQMLEALPLNARDLQQLAVLQTGVQPNAYHNLGPQMIVNGSRAEHNRFLLNGIDTSFTYPTSPVSAAGVIMGIEAVQEFKLLAGDYGAAYGEKGGGVVNTITKSGTNRFHGSVYEFFRDDAFDARNFFDRGNVPPFNRHQFGGSLGGPLRRDKTFFFANYENLRHRLNLSNLAIVPDGRARKGCLPDSRIGGEACAPVAQQVAPYLALFPEPNGANQGDGTAEFFSNPLQRVDDQYATLRIDHRLSPRDSFSGVYTGDWSKEFTPTQNPNFADHRDYNKQIVSLQNVHTFSPTLLNTTRLGFNKSWYFFRTDTTVPIDPSLYFIPNPFFAPTDIGQFGVVSIAGLTGLGLTYTGTPITPRWFDYLALSATTDFNKTHHAHSLQFGASYKHSWDDTSVPNFGRGAFTFLSLRSFLEGKPNNFSVLVPGNPFDRNWRNDFFGFYLEDSIRARTNLTLTLGLRYEFVRGPGEEEGRITNLRGGVLDSTPTVGEPYFKQPRDLFAPRVGINWDPFGDGKTSVRAGGGVFYDLINAWNYFAFVQGNPPFGRTVTISNPPFPNALSAIPRDSPVDFWAVDFLPKNPTKYSYNVTLERELGKKVVVRLAYVGSQSRHLPRRGNENLYYPQVLSDGRLFWPATPQQRPNPSFRSIDIARFDANSFYNSFQAMLDRRVAKGLALHFNYTLGKCMDDSSTLYSVIGAGSLTLTGTAFQYIRDHKSSRGRCSFNNEQSANFSGVFDLPGANLTGLKGVLVGRWRASAIATFQSGFPFEVGTGYHNSRQGELGTGPDRPDWFAGCDAQSAILGKPEQYFDPTCFVPAAPGFLGNVGSRLLTGPKLVTSDWALTKVQHLSEQRRFEFSTEVFNMFNHANLATPRFVHLFNSDGSRVRSAGRITQTVSTSRQMQFAIRFVF
jgi:hypothetical protein